MHSFNYMRRQPLRLLFYLIIVPIAALSEVGLSWVLQVITDVVTGKQHFDYAWLCAGILLYIIARALLSFAQSFQRSRLLANGSRMLRNDLYSATLARSLNQFSCHDHGFFLAKFNKEVEVIEDTYYGTALRGYYLIWQLVFALAGTILIKPLVTVAIILLCIPSMLVPMFSQKKTGPAQTAVVDASTGYNNRVEDFINGFGTVKFNAAGSRFGNLFTNATAWLAKKEIHNQFVIKVISELLNFFDNIQYIGTWLLGGYLVLRGSITLGELVAFSQLMVFISYPLFSAADMLSQFYGGRAVVKNVTQYLQDAAPETPKAHLPQQIQAIDYHEVGLTVDDQPLLQGVDLHLATDRKYLIVGQSGSGKSTLMRQLFGYYQGYTGTITIDGIDLRDVSFSDITSHLTYVDQSTYLFNATLADNVTVFHDIPADKIRQAVAQSGLQDLLANNPDALQRMLSDKSTAISGGERQRLALARNRLKGPIFTIYDELTSGLDPRIATQIEDDLFASEQGLVLITHRYNPTIFAKADDIIVVNQGRIVTVGQDDSVDVQHALQQLGFL
ncbi:ABC transporter ATP-binding protein [Schleiferilactobacillus harbinensis]|uniref:ABC transporter ATP-binding protein n=1 Tax=Schleiferilactobacillus harbinensis TaxID=304207 RepID=UPI00123A13D4|nr:ABC transporter ATP-binding protein [Schleiferilactobacillus harbinensis]QEU48538.1 ABC transporter ATP-binding protein [Schleiferilactobacillus harbinensis]